MANLEFQEALDYLYGLQRFGMVFGLRNIENIAQALGSPHADLRAIHIGGTNGKGSTGAMIDAMLREGGYLPLEDETEPSRRARALARHRAFLEDQQDFERRVARLACAGGSPREPVRRSG